MRTEADRVVFSYARGKLALYLVGAVALAVLCAGAWWMGLAPPGGLKELILLLGGPFFGLIAALSLVNLVKGGNVVILDRNGLSDLRISRTQIPWSRIDAMTVSAIHRQSFLVLSVDPAFEASMPRTGLARWTRRPNAALGFDGLTVGMHGLDGTLDDLVAAIGRLSDRQQLP